MSTRTVAVLTAGRADLGPLAPVIAALDASPSVHLVVLVTGTHLDGPHGPSALEIDVGPTSQVVRFDAGIPDSLPSTFVAALGRIGERVSDALCELNVELLVLLGDRWELLGAAGAALLHQVPVAHLHGGEVTEGALDERVRHAVTKLADLHLCATDEAARRLRQLGEEESRIHVTGAPGLDRLAAVPPTTLDALSAELGVGSLTRPFGLVTYHPPTVDRSAVRTRARAVLDAAAATLGSAIVSYPGADPGADAVMDEIASARARHPRLTVVPSLGSHYPRAMAVADVMVGNSSSGIIEGASFGLPVVDVGDRQRGRLRGPNVIHVDDGEEAVRAGIEAALAPGFRASLAGLVNPYGDGRSAMRIAEILASVPLSGLGRKPFVDIDDVPSR